MNINLSYDFYRYTGREFFLHDIFCVILFTTGYVFDAFFFETKPFLNHEGRMTPWESIIAILSLFGFLD